MRTHIVDRTATGVSGPAPTCRAQTSGAQGAATLNLGCALLCAALLLQPHALAMSVDLGGASGFAILAGSGLTIAGAVNTTTVTGDIGTFPTATITGLANLVLEGTNHGGDAVAQNAKTALGSAYSDAAGRAYTTLYGAVFDLGGQTLTAGVYKDPTSLAITGTLTLDAQGDPNAVWIFQAGSTLTAAVGSEVKLINGAQAQNVIWQVGSSATLGTDAYFVGSLLALESITLNTGATVNGRALALNGTVTLDNNVISVPEANTLYLFGLGAVALAAVRRRFKPAQPSCDRPLI